MSIARIALLFVVFLDVMSQGLVIPILTTILLDPTQGYFVAHASDARRQFDFGLVMGAFFLAWFLGAAYISKLSDSIGRKAGILVCLSGNLLGYILTITSLYLDSFALLIVARIISGFTAGNQPIAQAALIDLSADDQQKTRFMGLVLVSLSLGLVVGPLIGGLLSDPAVLGAYASLELPFYAVSALVVLNIVLIILFFQDVRRERKPLRIRPQEVFLTLWHAAQRPTVRKLSLVFFFAQLALNSYYVFMDNYFYSRFQFDTLQNSIALVVLGVAMALTSAFVVAPLNQRYPRIRVIVAGLALMAVSTGASIVNPSPIAAYILIAPMIFGFAIYYPTVLTLFSVAVSEGEQGWVMGVTVALYTLGAAIISLMGGRLMAIDIHLPFITSLASALLALLLMAALWRGEDIRALDRR